MKRPKVITVTQARIETVADMRTFIGGFSAVSHASRSFWTR
jgi:hypothetical protein